jgi:hypothetical protein
MAGCLKPGDCGEHGIEKPELVERQNESCRNGLNDALTACRAAVL